MANNTVNIERNEINEWTQYINYRNAPADHPQHIWFQVIPPVIAFENIDDDLMKLNSLLKPSRSSTENQVKVVILDKKSKYKTTQFLAKYCQDYKNNYDNNVVWIKEPFETCIRQLAVELNIRVNQEQQNRNFQQICTDIGNYFSTKKALMVFDVVDNSNIFNFGRRLTECRQLTMVTTSNDSSYDYWERFGWEIIEVENFNFNPKQDDGCTIS